MKMKHMLWIRSARVAVVLALATCLTSAWSAQTVHLTLSIDGTQIEGESTVTSLDREGTIECLSFTEEGFTPREAASGQLTGRRQYLPITFTKRVDQTSPLLQKAMAMNEPIDEATFRFYRPSPTGEGGEEQYFTVKITNGYVSSIRRISPDTLDPVTANRPVTEEISFVFQTITWTYEANGATHYDSYNEIN